MDLNYHLVFSICLQGSGVRLDAPGYGSVNYHLVLAAFTIRRCSRDFKTVPQRSHKLVTGLTTRG